MRIDTAVAVPEEKHGDRQWNLSQQEFLPGTSTLLHHMLQLPMGEVLTTDAGILVAASTPALREYGSRRRAPVDG